jgi:hypothetical protein
MSLVKDDVVKFFNSDNKKIPEDLRLVKSTSITIGQAFM